MEQATIPESQSTFWGDFSKIEFVHLFLIIIIIMSNRTPKVAVF